MNISALRRCFDAAVKVQDPVSILEILDKLYYAEEWDLFEDWLEEVKLLLDEIEEGKRDYYKTQALEYNYV